jgi:hypothetical protein
MPTIFVLDVPEFASLIELAAMRSGFRSHPVAAHYVAISADPELVLSRRGLRMKPAIWFGVLTGGFDGVVLEFSRNVLRIGAAVERMGTIE